MKIVVAPATGIKNLTATMKVEDILNAVMKKALMVPTEVDVVVMMTTVVMVKAIMMEVVTVIILMEDIIPTTGAIQEEAIAVIPAPVALTPATAVLLQWTDPKFGELEQWVDALPTVEDVGLTIKTPQ